MFVRTIGNGSGALPFHVTFGIIRVCLDLTGLFRYKDKRPVLMIRLARRGARKQPHYRIVVIEKARARNGRPVEVVGTYNPRTNPASVEMKRDRVEYWVSKGAQMSERVGKLFAKTPAPAAAGSAA
jgi:small subunit ribosomal protein S16